MSEKQLNKMSNFNIYVYGVLFSYTGEQKNIRISEYI